MSEEHLAIVPSDRAVEQVSTLIVITLYYRGLIQHITVTIWCLFTYIVDDLACIELISSCFQHAC